MGFARGGRKVEQVTGDVANEGAVEGADGVRGLLEVSGEGPLRLVGEGCRVGRGAQPVEQVGWQERSQATQEVNPGGAGLLFHFSSLVLCSSADQMPTGSSRARVRVKRVR